jgi:hypothetical protein
MRWMVPLFALTFGFVTLAAEEKEKPLTPAEAIKRIDKQVTVEMKVKASKNALAKFKEIYLDSEENYKDEKNLAIAISESCVAKYGKLDIKDPAAHFKGKTIRVTGKVILRQKRPRIEVSDPKQIQIVVKKE